MSDSDVYVWTETWTLEKIGARPSSGTWTELEGCEASVSVAMHENPDPNADAQGLNLSIPDFASLSVKERLGIQELPASMSPLMALARSSSLVYQAGGCSSDRSLRRMFEQGKP